MRWSGRGGGLRVPGLPRSDYAGYTVWRGLVPDALPNVPVVLSEAWDRGARFGIAVLAELAVDDRGGAVERERDEADEGQ
nr:hypothetical protein GCM10017745_75180 [Saccharothrix mutabilis subsp. capreolus]